MVKFISTFLVLISLDSHAHGENKPGPNGGLIKMPGSFHTELVVEGRTARVYLLDINFKNPVTHKSQVSMRADGKEIVCGPKKNFFECSLPPAFSSLTVKSIRNGSVGKEVQYQLSLGDHSHHKH